MYDIKIFFEENWQFWAKVNMWKEKIYAIWDNYNELLHSLKEWVEFSISWKRRISEKSYKLSKFLQIDSKKYASQI